MITLFASILIEPYMFWVKCSVLSVFVYQSPGNHDQEMFERQKQYWKITQQNILAAKSF